MNRERMEFVYLYAQILNCTQTCPCCGGREVKVVTVVGESKIWELQKLTSQNHRISKDTVRKAHSDITETPYLNLVKNHILQKVLETTIGKE